MTSIEFYNAHVYKLNGKNQKELTSDSTLRRTNFELSLSLCDDFQTKRAKELPHFTYEFIEDLK